ncbi:MULTISPECIES: peptidoglycan-binding domain-containing protein [Nostocales]|uniref:Peptidoglycan-binding protein n=3 Tax=Nostocales TaxID=1161 RepID=A0A8S9TC83_9CYAN|nr:peptidoglycan-binding domain-containing protein [Tolypothrix bouteillei]KAF3889222.1 peptidoglycan-binding protein [Tolypothrix bouteillei VB521301]
MSVNVQISQSLPTLENGSQGEDVRYLQRILNCLEYGSVATDGKFGPQTENAVKQFQGNYPPLAVDGIVGQQTWWQIIRAFADSSLCNK